MALHLHFIRHGETQDNIDLILQGWRDTSLTPNGHADAHTLATKLADTKLDAVYHSPLIRITQTLEPILASHSNLKAGDIHVDPDLRGQGLGELEGRSYGEVDLGNPRSADDQPGVEKFNVYVARLRACLGRIVGREAPLVGVGGGDRHVLVASHGVSITSIFKMLESTPQCDGFNRVLAERGPEAWEVRYPASVDIAELVAREAGSLPVKDGELDWDALEKSQGKPFLIVAWGRKENAK